MTKSGPSPFECFSFLFEGSSLEGVVWSVCCCRHEGNEEGHEEGNSICSTNEEVRSCLSIAGRPIRDDGNGAVAEPSSNLTRACRMLGLVFSQFSQACTVHDPSLGSIWDFGVLGLKKHVHAVFLAISMLSFSLMNDMPSIHCQLQNHVSAKSCHVLAD